MSNRNLSLGVWVLLIIQMSFSIPAFALSDQVKIDIVTTQLSESLTQGDNAKILRATKKLRSLDVDDARLDFFDGQALFNMERYDEAKKSLESYINLAGRKGEFYSDTINMLAKLESLIAASSGQPETRSGVSLKSESQNATNEAFKCPDIDFPFARLDSISTPALRAGPEVIAKGHTCYYGENAQYNIQLFYPTGNKGAACISSEWNQRAAVKRMNLPPEQLAQFLKPVLMGPPTELNLFGFQIEDIKGEEAVKVARVLAGSGAEKAGIKLNDKIVSINGESSSTMNRIIAIQTLFNAENSVVISVMRSMYGNKPMAYDLKISKIKYYAPRAIIIKNPNDLSVVRLEAPFNPGGEEEFKYWIDIGKSFFRFSDGKAIKCD